MSTEEKLDLVLAELKSLRADVAGRPAPAAVSSEDPYTTAEMMKKLGHTPKSKSKFWNTVYTKRVPFTRINERKVIFPRAAVDAWFSSRARNQVPA
jgi:predicted DNA-binding transcriptional regulator AlpA